MRKDRVYLLKMALKSEGNDIIFAECGCPAGKGPRGSCKHIAALSYAILVEFAHFPNLYRSVAAMEPTSRSSHELGSRRRELLPTVKRTLGSGVIFDPRPPHLRGLDTFSRIERLRCD